MWGGQYIEVDSTKPGGRYDPATDTWHTINAIDPPTNRQGATGVWTGTELIVWGGWGGASSTNVKDTGGRYDPTTDSWTATSTGPGVPAARTGHAAVWTGTEMVVLGGCPTSSCFFGSTGTGGRYDPVADTWQATSLVGAPAARGSHTAVWTGSEMIVWGGEDLSSHVDSGGRYDPASDSWSALSTVNAPAARIDHTAVWTGGEMVVWGGTVGGVGRSNTGGRYDPATDSWQATAFSGAPEARKLHSAVWDGSRMIAWGGCVNADCSQHRNTGGRYDPAADAWTLTSTTGAPSARSQHRAIWTGTEMIVWGGCSGGECQISLGTGGRYDPVGDTWVPTGGETGPSARINHSAVWTGSEMIVWGGWSGTSQNNGKRYDPATDHWTPLSGSGAPFSRDKHSAVWTGTEMILWGGSVSGIGAHDSGGRYDPTTGSWSPTGTVGAPVGRLLHSAVWTGSEMIVWGGCTSGSCLDHYDTGGRYDPATDGWTATSTAGAPRGRTFHGAVWTGDEMIVWGGRSLSAGPEGTGGRYAPATDSWTGVSTAGAPAARQSLAAVWSGTEMIVWGGRDDAVLFGDGARFDPVEDGWAPISPGSAPQPRHHFSSIWTGSEMIVWGGYSDLSGNANHFTGGRYDPALDAWTPTSTGAFTASQRAGHTAVWTGSEMIVWGGWQTSGGTLTNTGARYCAAAASEQPLRPVADLTVERNGSGLRLDWTAGCGFAAPDYAVYVGTLGDWDSHVPAACSTGGSPSADIAAGAGSRFYVVVPRDAQNEGSYGTTSEGAERSASATACVDEQNGTACPEASGGASRPGAARRLAVPTGPLE